MAEADRLVAAAERDRDAGKRQSGGQTSRGDRTDAEVILTLSGNKRGRRRGRLDGAGQ